jgi:hypothetical protein
MSVYTEEHGGFRPQRRLQRIPSVGLQENIKGLFIDKIKCAIRSGVRSIAGGMIDLRLVSVQSHTVRSISRICLRIPTVQVS